MLSSKTSMGVPKPPVLCLCVSVCYCLSLVKHLYSVPRLFCTQRCFLFMDYIHTVRGNRSHTRVCVGGYIHTDMFLFWNAELFLHFHLMSTIL